MSEEVEIDKLEKLIDRCNECKFATCENCEINWTEVQAIKGLLDLYKNLKEIEKSNQEENGKLRVELEKYKRLAEMNLKDSEEFQNNMCEHRCILHNEIEELKTELFEEKEKNKTKVDIKDIEFSNFIKERYVRKDKLKFILSKLNISDVEPWSTYKIDGQILFDLQELL